MAKAKKPQPKPQAAPVKKPNKPVKKKGK